jgi:DCN1-like protein 1/2
VSQCWQGSGNVTDGILVALETAQALWGLLLPHGLQGGALSHLNTPSTDTDNDVEMDGVEQGWTQTQTQLWFEFLAEKGLKGISRDTWQMVGDQTEYLRPDFTFNVIRFPKFREFVRSVDSRFSNHDQECKHCLQTPNKPYTE